MPNASFDGLLLFERDVYGDAPPIPAYDPYLIRYGEYRFVLDELGVAPGDQVLDVGCEWNLLCIYVASTGVDVCAVDIDPNAWIRLEPQKRRAETIMGRLIPLRFALHDATVLDVEPASADAVVAVSSVEHMFSADGDGDVLAIDAIARALRPGGRAVITVPMSNGGPFREAPDGDSQFGAPYRLYDRTALDARILSNPALVVTRLAFLAQTTPDPRFDHFEFARFRADRITPEERVRWGQWDVIFGSIFNPIFEADEDVSADRLNTALISFEKVGAAT